ncbi:MAG: hypothetical protein CFE49_16670 [Pseudomonas sp. PGPPP3]|nr:MAG: hypothetical protein CFE49_16670 [Pseudomonas sp. PGPPP3]
MTDSFVTQCPHCRTSFRVSRAQLSAAHGAVRCGACLHVFNAGQQLLSQLPQQVRPSVQSQPAAPRPAQPSAQPQAAAPTPAPTPAASTPAPAEQATPAGKQPSKTLWIHDDLDLDSIDLDDALAKLEEQEQQLSQDFLAIARAPDPTERFLNSREPAKAYDEDWAESLLRNDSNAARPAPPESRATVRSEVNTAPTPIVEPASAAPVEPAAAPSTPARSEPTLNLNSFQVESYTPSIEPEPLHAERDEPPLRAIESADDEHERDEPQEPIEQQSISDSDYRSPRNEPGLRDEGLLHLEQEPLQLDWQQPEKKSWGRTLGWLALNLFGLLALGAQYTNYHFDELARQDQYRPWFEQLCPEFGCKLPSKVEISLIKSSNLVVRSHPDFAGALIVDAILYNRAPFSQPFPLLELRFADMNGQLLASRRFKPSEYLAGELAGQAEMPPQTPIHIALDILDPGTKAVNYSLSFHSPE